MKCIQFNNICSPILNVQELSLVEKFRSQGGAMVREFCSYGTRDECDRSNMERRRCRKVRRFIIEKRIYALHYF